MADITFFKDIADKTRPLISELNKIPGTFVTGSAAVGGFSTFESDIDVVVPIEYGTRIEMLRAKFKLMGISSKPSNYNGGFKFIMPAHIIPVNIIILHPFDYCAWLFATNVLGDSDVIHDRNARHRVFELAVLLFKTINTTGRYTTTDGANMYCTQNRRRSVAETFEYIVRENTSELPV